MVSERYPLLDRTAVVVGAHGPIGAELRRALDAAGARVVEADAAATVEMTGPADVLVVHTPQADEICESFAHAMARRGGGSIVLVEGSDESVAARCEAMAARWESHGVRVNSLAHGTLTARRDVHGMMDASEPAPPSLDELRALYRAALVTLASPSSRVTGFRLVADGRWLPA